MLLPRVVTLITGLGLSALAQAAPTDYPLTIENCGSPSLSSRRPPAR